VTKRFPSRQNELAKEDNSVLEAEKILFYNRANREVAILCNHQRSVPKGFDASMDQMKAKFDSLLRQREVLEQHLENVQAKKGKKVKIEPREDRVKLEKDRVKEEKVKAEDGAAAAERKGEDAETEEEMIARLTKNSDPAAVKQQLEKLNLRVDNHKTKMALKDDTKTVALGTSKINYMDPRITVAWCKRSEVPIEKVFNKGLLAKFPWAMEVEPDWAF
jgi:DNA topoisomerase-1